MELTSLCVWLLGVFFVARLKKGISALRLQKDTGLGSYQTAWNLLHELRSGLSALPAPLLEGDIEAGHFSASGMCRRRPPPRAADPAAARTINQSRASFISSAWAAAISSRRSPNDRLWNFSTASAAVVS